MHLSIHYRQWVSLVKITISKPVKLLSMIYLQKVPRKVDLVVIEQACNGEDFRVPILLGSQPRGIERMIRQVKNDPMTVVISNESDSCCKLTTNAYYCPI